MFAKFDEILSMILQVLRKQNVTDARSDFRSVGRTDNVKTVYPPTNIVCGGYRMYLRNLMKFHQIRNICLVHINVFAKFDEILSMILQDIKETKRYGRTVGLSFGRTDNVKTVYPPTNIVCRGYNQAVYYHRRWPEVFS